MRIKCQKQATPRSPFLKAYDHREQPRYWLELRDNGCAFRKTIQKKLNKLTPFLILTIGTSV